MGTKMSAKLTATDHLKLKQVMQQFEDKPDLKQIMKEDKCFGPVYSDLLDTGGKNSMNLLTKENNWLNKLKVCLKFAHLADDIVDGIAEHLHTKQKLEITEIWDDCVSNGDLIGLLHLLQNNRYPDRKQLRSLCDKFGRKHPLTIFVCERICDFIRGKNPQLSSENIIRPVYEVKDEKEIIFLIDDESNDGKTNKIDVDKIDVTIELRNLRSPNSENEKVIHYELEKNVELDYEMMDQMEKYINDNSERLCKEHSNIIMITASPVKSTDYNNDKKRKHSIIKRNCIVLFVPAKGFIPLQENCFPKKLGSFETDVREGYCELLAGEGPRERHEHLKMGCAIGIQSDINYGTLGGFVDHPHYGLCAVTCAHVVLTKEEKKSTNDFSAKKIVQPHMGDEFGIVEKEMYKYSLGKDAALIKITKQERNPNDGDFPDCTQEERELAGFAGKENMLYRSGKILKLDNANRVEYDKFRLVKFGAKTSLRRGKLWRLRITFTYLGNKFKNIMQIIPYKEGQIFADEGDSGSFVFIVTPDTEFLLIGMLIGRDKGSSGGLVTPINDVLAALDCNDTCIKTFVPDVQREIINRNNNVSQDEEEAYSDQDSNPGPLDYRESALPNGNPGVTRESD